MLSGMTTRSGAIHRLRAAVLSYRYLFFFTSVFCTSFIFIFINNNVYAINHEIIRGSWDSRRYEIVDIDDSFTIKTEGCTISALQPLDASVKRFVEYPSQMKACVYSDSALLDSNDTHIWVVKDNFYYHNISEYGNFTCCYRAFDRPSSVTDINSRNIDDRVHYSDCIYFSDSFEVSHEFVRVVCYYQEMDVFEQYFLFTPKKGFTDDRNVDESDPTELPSNNNDYNVVLMGIDAVSRMNFHRTMPKTLAFLEQKNAIELLGYNKLGDNTFPNIVPMLMGIKDKDLKRTCLPRSRSTFDNCPFIWDWFKEAGYYTALGEDSARLGTFNYQKLGFSGSPTDYYLYTFMHESEKNVGNNKDFNSYLCMGTKYYFRVLLDYVQSLTSTLKSSKLFGFFWEVSMSHDYLNYPMVMDDSYESFFKNLDSSKYLDKTIFILVSDHGMRWGDIRNTKQGRLEERLPFLFVLLPSSFRESYEAAYNNLRTNAGRLTTPFDVHETLLDLVNVSALYDENILARSARPRETFRAMSLFLPIPENRTCAAAEIDEHWCTCHTSRKMSTDSDEAVEGSQRVVAHVNNLLHGHPQCARLQLQEVLDAAEVDASEATHSANGFREYTVVMRVKPGGAVFEATLRQDDDRWTVSGSVSRLNLYGDQSRCIYDYRLKLYCFCR